ncbi:MAG: L-threonylcarbamoyladenylate synthase [Deltaproteobacteria bacterium]|nr:L-threonylcarbamoyladenylate synthase [Deltaproteobacteria bacterium]MCL6119594.1 L-threonylcarbamoyladenylate synthase [Deltaproteobacteria bacterium]
MVKIYKFDALTDEDYILIKEHLKNSGIIIYPTETSYAIGGNALNDNAVKKIYAFKGRDFKKPLPILVKDLKMLVDFAELKRPEEDLISKFWPGPLTIVFKLKKKILLKNCLFTGGLDSFAARISPHPFAEKIFDMIDFPLISTSANSSGKESFSNFNELNKIFLSGIPEKDCANVIAINAGELTGGSSTIIRLVKNGKNIVVVREGENNIKKRLMCSIKNN